MYLVSFHLAFSEVLEIILYLAYYLIFKLLVKQVGQESRTHWTDTTTSERMRQIL